MAPGQGLAGKVRPEAGSDPALAPFSGDIERMRIPVLGGVGIVTFGWLLGCAEEAGNPNRFGLNAAGAATYADTTGTGPVAEGVGGVGGDPVSAGGSDALGANPSANGGAIGNGGASANGGTAAGGFSTAAGGVSGFAPDGSAGGSESSGGSGAGGSTCGGFLQPACATGGAGGATTCGGFLQPACATGGAGGDSGNGGAGGADQCANETCFDIFDCFLYFPNAAACKFTKCEGLICKP